MPQLQDLSMIVMIVAMFAIMYFLIIRPQKKKEKETKAMLAALAVGDVITTIGGIIGKVVKVKEDEVVIQTGSVGNPNEQSYIRFTKGAIGSVTKKAEAKPEPTPIPTEEEEAKEEE